jgi:Zn-dependent protease
MGAVRNRFWEVKDQMFGSLKLGKLFGIDTSVHGTFWLLPLFILLSNLGAGAGALAFELLFVFAVFFCVALHEVGHALAAAAYGIRTRDITLYPIGGIASLEGMPEKPRQEIVVALAGPAVNVVIAVGLLLGVLVSGLVLPWLSTPDVLEKFVGRLFWANVVLCVFNLLPCFPMDGGRVLRALLAIRMTRLRATEVTMKVGTVVAAMLLVAGVALPEFTLIPLAIVVWLLGQAELAGTRVAEAHREFERRARELFGGSPTPAAAPAATPLPADAAADLAARRFSGLAWDAERRVWVQWLNGVPVRDLPT